MVAARDQAFLNHRRGLLLAAAAVASVLLCPSALAQESGVDPEEVRAFAEEFVAAEFDPARTGGAAVFVHGDDVLEYGFGVANIDSGVPVDPRTTGFPARSVSKAFTATAAMQLVGRGQLDLDADVNDYLTDIEVPDRDGEPITMAQLLTHTSGLDASSVGSLERTEDDVRPLGDYLADALPPRTTAPGQTVRYQDNNHTLAGHVLEQISGRSFDELLREELLLPLGMRNSGFTALPASSVAVGYSDDREALPYGHFNTAPAASLVTTPSDMAAFLRLHLAGGVGPDGQQLLTPDAARAMQTVQFSHDDRLPGLTYGFFEHVENEQRALVHTGTGLGFSSMVLLLPEHDAGIYLVYNIADPRPRAAFVEQFFDRFFPREMAAAAAVNGDVQRFGGQYVVLRDRTTFLGMGEQLFEQRTVSVTDDGTIRYADHDWRQVDPLLFEAVDDPDRHLAFRENDDGEITHLLTEHAFINEHDEALDRLSWSRTLPGFFALYGVFVLSFLAVIGVAIVRRIRHNVGSWISRTAIGTAGLFLVFLAAFPVAILRYADGPTFDYGMPPIVVVLLLVPVIGLVLSLVLTTAGLVSIARRAAPTALLVGLAGIGCSVFLNYWHLIGFAPS